MDCKEVATLHQLYLDGELDEQDRRMVDDHLHVCEPCRFQADYEQRFKDSIRIRIPRMIPDMGFRESLLKKATNVTENSWFSKPLVWGSVPAFVVLGVVVAFTWTVTSGFSGLVNQVVDQHSIGSPVEVNTSNSEEVEGWFREKINFNVALPRFGQKKINLVGARLSHLAQSQVALVRYRRGIKNFSLFVLSDPGRAFEGGNCQMVHSRQVCFSELRGYTVVLWRSRGLAYSLVSDSGPKEIVEVLASAQSF